MQRLFLDPASPALFCGETGGAPFWSQNDGAHPCPSCGPAHFPYHSYVDVGTDICHYHTMFVASKSAWQRCNLIRNKICSLKFGEFWQIQSHYQNQDGTIPSPQMSHFVPPWLILSPFGAHAIASGLSVTTWGFLSPGAQMWNHSGEFHSHQA